ncbi:MAG: Gfo/Idh/MocA family oxidoreductase [Bdellovibrio sp.]|nr:Gfo/Idh/MocA family oxidoreductase [Bdellovibrio sp.]
MTRVNVSVVGVGRWGPNLTRNFYSNPDSFVVSVADKDITRLKLLEPHYPGIIITESADVIFKDSTVDAVVICTPTAMHYELAKKALENNKHVFVEKPLARDSKECKELITLAKKMNKVLFVGHIFLYNAGIQAVRKLIQNGDLGKIFYYQITRTNLGPIRTDVSSLWDLASHDLAILNYWQNAMPTKVSALGGRFINPGNEDTVFATYTFSNNVLANIHVSWLNPKKVREIVIVGEKKMVVWDDMDLSNPVRIYDKNVTVDRPESALVDTFAGFRASIHEGDTLLPKIRINEPLYAECDAFLKAVRDPSSCITPGEQGLAVVQALEATDRSLRENGKEIPINY